MERESEKIPKKEFYPLVISMSAVFLAILEFFVVRGPNLNLWIPVGTYIFLDVAILFALVYSFTIKNRPLQIFSILFSAFLFVLMSGLIYILLIAIGIGGA